MSFACRVTVKPEGRGLSSAHALLISVARGIGAKLLRWSGRFGVLALRSPSCAFVGDDI